MQLLKKFFKAIALYAIILSSVTAAAAVIGCTLLPNGSVAFLFDPQALFKFLWVTRAGLKVTIIIVAFFFFFLLVEDGVLGRRWVS